MNLMKHNSLWATVFSLFVVVMAFDLGSIASANRQSIGILRANNRVMIDNLNSETGQRGYLLTGDKNYLVPFNNYQNQITDDLITLKKNAVEDQDKVNMLMYLSNEKSKEMRATIEAYDKNGVEAALKIVKKNDGKLYMDQIRYLYNAISTSRRQDFEVQLDRLEFRIKVAYYMLSISFLLTILTSAFDAAALFSKKEELLEKSESRQRDSNS